MLAVCCVTLVGHFRAFVFSIISTAFVERGCRGGVRVSALGRRSEGKCGEHADGCYLFGTLRWVSLLLLSTARIVLFGIV